MKKALREILKDVIKPIDIVFNFEQFTIDWIEEKLEIDYEEFYKNHNGAEIADDNGALQYDINILLEVMKDGKDKTFFRMLLIYGSLFNK